MTHCITCAWVPYTWMIHSFIHPWLFYPHCVWVGGCGSGCVYCTNINPTCCLRITFQPFFSSKEISLRYPALRMIGTDTYYCIRSGCCFQNNSNFSCSHQSLTYNLSKCIKKNKNNGHDKKMSQESHKKNHKLCIQYNIK